MRLLQRMTLIIDHSNITKLSKKKKTKKPPVSKVPAKPERNLEKHIQEFRKAVVGPVIDDFQLMLKSGASYVEMAEYLELKLTEVQYLTGRTVEFIVDIWKSEMDRETREKFDKSMSHSLGIDITAVLDSPEIKEALHIGGIEAANLIKTIPTEFLGDVAQAVSQSFRGEQLPQGRTLIDQIMHIGGVSENRARLIARDQTGKMFAILDKTRQTSAGIEMYIWRTSKDQAVVGRPGGLYPKGNKRHGNHWKMEGLYCRWDDPTVYSEDQGKTWKKRKSDMPMAHPGQEINCRCVSSPVINIDQIIQAAIAA